LKRDFGFWILDFGFEVPSGEPGGVMLCAGAIGSSNPEPSATAIVDFAARIAAGSGLNDSSGYQPQAV
jgi:hypothetical protein